MFLFIVVARQFSLPGFTNADTDVDENALADKGVKSMVCNGRYNLMVVGRLDRASRFNVVWILDTDTVAFLVACSLGALMCDVL